MKVMFFCSTNSLPRLRRIGISSEQPFPLSGKHCIIKWKRAYVELPTWEFHERTRRRALSFHPSVVVRSGTLVAPPPISHGQDASVMTPSVYRMCTPRSREVWRSQSWRQIRAEKTREILNPRQTKQRRFNVFKAIQNVRYVPKNTPFQAKKMMNCTLPAPVAFIFGINNTFNVCCDSTTSKCSTCSETKLVLIAIKLYLSNLGRNTSQPGSVSRGCSQDSTLKFVSVFET